MDLVWVVSFPDRKMLQLSFVLRLCDFVLLTLRFEASDLHVGSGKLRPRCFQLSSAREQL